MTTEPQTEVETKGKGKEEYEIIAGSYSASVTDDDGNVVDYQKYRIGERLWLTPDQALKLVNIVAPVNRKPVKAVEAPKSIVATSVRPLNEIGAGKPQDPDVESDDIADADKKDTVDGAKANDILAAAAETDKGAAGGSSATTPTTTAATDTKAPPAAGAKDAKK